MPAAILGIVVPCAAMATGLMVTASRAARRVANAGAASGQPATRVKIGVSDLVINSVAGLIAGAFLEMGFAGWWSTEGNTSFAIFAARALIWPLVAIKSARLAMGTLGRASQSSAARSWLFLGWMIPFVVGLTVIFLLAVHYRYQ